MEDRMFVMYNPDRDMFLSYGSRQVGYTERWSYNDTYAGHSHDHGYGPSRISGSNIVHIMATSSPSMGPTSPLSALRGYRDNDPEAAGIVLVPTTYNSDKMDWDIHYEVMYNWCDFENLEAV